MLGAGMLRNYPSVGRAATASLLVSVGFFLASNFTVWAEWGMYAKTFSGLGACYIAALPFFRNSVVSETFFSVLIFGISGYYRVFLPARRMQNA
jgi:hypothetical protein